MAVKIRNVKIIDKNGSWEGIKQSFANWQEVAQLPNWDSLRDSYEIPVTVNVGEQVTIMVTAEDVTWGTIKTDFQTWNDIKTSLTDWKSVQNYH